MPVITSANEYIFYHYNPSIPGASVVAGLFALGTLAVMWRSITTKTKFGIPFIIGGILEIVGYVARALAEDMKNTPLIPYIIQNILLLVAPALFAASIYMTLGRLVLSVHGETRSVISPSRLTKIFVTIDVVSFWAQATGGGLQAAKHFNKDTAKYIILAGLMIQVVGFGLFVVTACSWHLRIRRYPTGVMLADSTKRWQKILRMLYMMSVLIMIRSVFRFIEYVLGTDGYLLRHEWPLYVFDATLMMSTVGIFAWWYPGRLDVSSVGTEDVYESERDIGLESGLATKKQGCRVPRDGA